MTREDSPPVWTRSAAPALKVRRFLAMACLLGLAVAAFPIKPAWSQDPVTGVTEPLHELTLGFPVAGRIHRVEVSEGDRVQAGQVLISLDNTLEQLDVKRRELLLADTAALDEARRRERILRKQWQEGRSLLERNSVSRKQVEDEQLLYEAALAERRGLEMEKKREQVDLDQARENLARRVLRAPIAGIVTRLHYHVGESISAHEGVLNLVDVSRGRFIGNMPSASGLELAPGQTVRLRMGEVDREATVVFVSPVADKASGVVEIRAEFGNADGRVRPGVGGLLFPANAPGGE